MKVLERIADLQFMNKDYPAALQNFLKIEKSCIKLNAMYRSIALCFLNLGDYTNSKNYFEKYFRLDHAPPEQILYNYAYALFKCNLFANALKVVKKLQSMVKAKLKFQVNFLEIEINHKISKNSGKPNALTKLAKKYPDEHSLNKAIGMAQIQKGDFKTAIKAFKSTLTVSPDNYSEAQS